MHFEWDEAKRQANLRKHGLDFADAEHLFTGATVTIEDVRKDYGERRFLTIGLSQGRAVVIAHTEEENRIRVISMRKASRYEEKSYRIRI